MPATNDRHPPWPLDVNWDLLRARLDRVAAQLTRQGCLCSRRTGRSSHAWSVRYYEVVDCRRVQRALYVGNDPFLLRKTRDYLAPFGKIRNGSTGCRISAASPGR